MGNTPLGMVAKTAAGLIIEATPLKKHLGGLDLLGGSPLGMIAKTGLNVIKSSAG